MKHLRRSVILMFAVAASACQGTPDPGGGAPGAAGAGGSPPTAGTGGGSAGNAGGSAGGSAGAGGASGSGGSAGSAGSPGGGAAGAGGAPTPPPSPDGGSAGDGGPASIPVPTGEVVPSPGCAGGAMVPGPNGAQMIMATGKNRRFIIRMPGGYDGKKALPVIFAFHGAGGGAAGFETGVMSGLSKMAADKALRVFPEAMGGTWSRDENDDVLFFDTIVEWMKTRVCFDTARLFATGQSSGAYFANRLGCNRGGVIRAVGTNSGGQRREYPLGPCRAPVAAWLSNGASDNPGHVMGTQQARDWWLKTNGCTDDKPMPASPAPCVAYPGCPKAFPVHYCQHGGGHAFPGYATGGIFDFFFNSGL